MRVANVKKYLGSADVLRKRRLSMENIEDVDVPDERRPLHESVTDGGKCVDELIYDFRHSLRVKSAIERLRTEQQGQELNNGIQTFSTTETRNNDEIAVEIETSDLSSIDTYMLSVQGIGGAGCSVSDMSGTTQQSIQFHGFWTGGGSKASIGTASTSMASSMASSVSTRSSRRRHPGAFQSRLARNKAYEGNTSNSDGWIQSMEDTTKKNSCAWTPKYGLDYKQSSKQHTKNRDSSSFPTTFASNSFPLDKDELCTGVWNEPTLFDSDEFHDSILKLGLD